MEYILIIIMSIIAIFLLKIGLNIHIKDIKKIKQIGYDEKTNKIGDKFPKNREICEEILKQLNNTNVMIEEEKESKTSLYIAISNKIIIADIQDTFTRIQTIAHECLHSVQNRRILFFNFIYSNIFLLYFIAAIFLILFNIGNVNLYINIFLILSIIYCIVRMYLENEAMSKAIYVAEKYMKKYQQKDKNVTDEDIEMILNKLDELNRIGIPITNFQLTAMIIVKVIILAIFALI